MWPRSLRPPPLRIRVRSLLRQRLAEEERRARKRRRQSFPAADLGRSGARWRTAAWCLTALRETRSAVPRRGPARACRWRGLRGRVLGSVAGWALGWSGSWGLPPWRCRCRAAVRSLLRLLTLTGRPGASLSPPRLGCRVNIHSQDACVYGPEHVQSLRPEVRGGRAQWFSRCTPARSAGDPVRSRSHRHGGLCRGLRCR